MSTTVGDFFDQARIRGLDESAIDDEAVPSSYNATPNDGAFELLRGGKGDDGPAGPPAVAYSWRGEVADETALIALKERLELKHVGRAYRVLSTQRLVYWDGQDFVSFVDAFGGKGPDGPKNTLTIGTVTTGAIGSALVVTITGSSPNQVIDLTVPRGGPGQKGPVGPPGPIRSAPDFDNSVTAVAGMVPIWDDVADKWKLGRRPGPIGPYTIPDSGFTSIVTPTSAATVIASITVPAQPKAWIPWVRGHLMATMVGPSASDRVWVEVFQGPVANGLTVAVGYVWQFTATSAVVIQPYYGSTGIGAVPPNTQNRLVPANTAMTFYVQIRRVAGSGTFKFDKVKSQLMIYGFEPNIPLPVV